MKTLNDYMIEARIGDENANHIGMIEQIIMANAYTFIGTPLSTFTNFITRMRGYYNISSDPVSSFIWLLDWFFLCCFILFLLFAWLWRSMGYF